MFQIIINKNIIILQCEFLIKVPKFFTHRVYKKF